MQAPDLSCQTQSEHSVQILLSLFLAYLAAQVGGEIAQRLRLPCLLLQPPILITVLIVTFLAVMGKLAGGASGARSPGKPDSLVVGIGMVPRGEVGIIVASIGMQAKVFAGSTYAEIIAMSLLTSVIAPPLLGRLTPTPPEATGPHPEHGR